MVERNKTIDLVYYFKELGWCWSKDGQLQIGYSSQFAAANALFEHLGIKEK